MILSHTWDDIIYSQRRHHVANKSVVHVLNTGRIAHSTHG
jgi:hypothetical protein